MREARGVWVTRWDYRSPDDVKAILAAVAAAGFNQVFFQVRGAGDAYYRSRLAPWAASLGGKLGRDPGWDPLALACGEARRLGLELHAWINVCTGWKGAQPPGRSRPRHLLRAHPDWRVRDRRGRAQPYADGAYIFVNPAQPAFQTHLEAIVAELVSFYAIDGLHLDYARYPAQDSSFDRTSQRLYRKARKREPGLDRAVWQRRVLADFVGRLRERALEARPDLRVSAAVTGIYLDRWGWGQVTQGLVDFHQDSHLWAEQGAVDTLVPMIYWPPAAQPGQRCDFGTLVADFAPLGEKVGLQIGINAEAGDYAVLEREIAIVREHGLDGVVIFAWSALYERGFLDLLGRGVFHRPAVPPGGEAITAPAPRTRAGSSRASAARRG